MNKIIIFFILGICFFSCTNDPGKSSLKNSPDLFGWTEQHIDSLKNQCLERYDSSNPGKNKKHKENYCDCLVEKIIYSVKFEQHRVPDDETVKLYEQFSGACEELTQNEEQ